MMATIFNSAILDSSILHKTLTQTSSIWLKLIHSDSTWWRQPSWVLPSWIQPFCTKKKLHSFILTQLDDCSYVEICHPRFSHFVQKELQSFIISQLDDGSHLEFCHYGFSYFAQKKNFTHSFWLNFMMAAILNSANMDSAILHKTLIQTSSIWLKLIHCHSTWWWQPFWILPSWFQTLSSWIQTPCYLLSDSLKNTLPQLWPWLKLIQSD